MLVEPFSAKKPLRHPARPAVLPAVETWDAELAVDHPARLIDAFVNGLDRPACRQLTLGSGPSPTTRTSCSRSSCTRPLKAVCRPQNGLAMCETARPWDGSVRGFSRAGPPCTPFGTGCLSQSSTCTPRQSDRPSPKGSPPPRKPSSTAHRSGPMPRGINWSTRTNSPSNSRNWTRLWKATRPVDRSNPPRLDGRDCRWSAGTTGTIPAGRRRTRREIGREPGTPQG